MLKNINKNKSNIIISIDYENIYILDALSLITNKIEKHKTKT